MCIFDPTPYLERSNIDIKSVCGGYDPYKMNKRFRSLGILTNRDGSSYVKSGMTFLGETGRFYELPKPDAMNEDLYNRISKLKKIDI